MVRSRLSFPPVPLFLARIAHVLVAVVVVGCRLPAMEIEQAPPGVNRSSQKLQRVRRAFPHPAAE